MHTTLETHGSVHMAVPPACVSQRVIVHWAASGVHSSNIPAGDGAAERQRCSIGAERIAIQSCCVRCFPARESDGVLRSDKMAVHCRVSPDIVGFCLCLLHSHKITVR